ncbi:MAG: DNA adenine methylase, partial [Acidobacteria bacterium]|nr:DNA adenine methylase [Acidobacteriota bacterium]
MSEIAAPMRAPFPWMGGKSRVADIVWAAFDDVPNYVEPFFGSGAVLLARPHQPRIETVNDADGLLANLWRAIKAAPDEVAEHADWPVNECDLHARHLWLVEQRETITARLHGDPDFYDSKLAGWWVWGCCSWIGG